MKADIVVVGAGALGLSTALHCAIAGSSVVVVERDTAGSAASGRAAGLFKSVQADRLRTDLARRSIDRARSFGDWAGAELEIVGSGSFLIAQTQAHREYLRTEHRQSLGWGADVRVAARGELAERAPWYQESGAELALWCPEDIYVDEPAALVRACVAAARLHGAVLLEHEAVSAITLTGGQVAGVQTERRSITAPIVVDAAGAWTRQVAELAGGARVAVAPVRHQLLITAPTAGVGPADPILRVVDAAVYLRPARGGLMLGGFEPGPLAIDLAAQPASFRTVPLDLTVLERLAGQVEHEVPLAGAVRAGAVAEHRGGMFTMSPDGRFVTGPVRDVPGLWVASGCNGSGFSSSLALGEALAQWMTTGASRAAEAPDIAELSPARFGPVTDEALITAGVWQYEHYYDPAAVATP